MRILLDFGADPALRTRIDDCTTPMEDAASAGFDEAAKLLGDTPGGGDKGRRNLACLPRTQRFSSRATD
jgi:hypothetical protein